MSQNERAVRLDFEYLGSLEHKTREDNPKEHDRQAIEASIREVGYVDPIVVNERDGLILAGHGRVEALAAMRDAGAEPPAGVRVDGSGDWLVPVIRGVDLDPEEAARYVVAANRTTELGGWAEDRLAAILSTLSETERGLAGTGYNDNDLGALARALAGAEPPAPVVEEQDPPKPEPKAKRGDLYALGRHRVFCGDSTRPDTLERLLGETKAAAVITDPPYAIYGSASGISSSITDDKIVRPFFRDVLRQAERATELFAHVYVCCDWRSYPSWWEVARGTHLEPKNLIVWDKGGGGLGNNYANAYELIAFFANMPTQKVMSSARATGQRPLHRANIIRASRVTGAERLHNAAKPVELLGELITNSTDEGDVVLDLFLGSGSTLIAAHREGRTCYGVDIEPEWVDVTIARWERLTGEQAQLLAHFESEDPWRDPVGEESAED